MNRPKRNNAKLPSRSSALRALVALALGATAGGAFAAATELAQTPLSSSAANLVKPNVSFILDTSGSMAFLHAPDEASPFDDKYGYKSPQCNSIFYNSNIKYVPPKTWNGVDYANSVFTDAWEDGYNTGSGKRNLSTSFRSHSDDSSQAAYYYKYTGSATFNYQSTTSTFYRECNSAIGSTPGKNVFTYVKVTSTSGPASSDERQNFANWYSYYRNRMNMMKSAAGRAFVSIGDSYRVGFMTIYVSPNNNVNDGDYLRISDFDDPQKEKFYKRFYAQSPSGNTPLKSALSRAGRNFAGELGPDPMQYSCQQNFAILTTDGYWNSGTANGVRLNGSTAIGNQDNVSSTMPRPMYDGGLTNSSNTLADVAAYYYNTDLRPTSGACNTGDAGADVCRNNVPVSGLDDAPHQHMTTFTVGLGVNGQLLYADNYLTGGSSDFNAIKGGSKNWPSPTGDTLTTIDDLWHAAVNGRGQYFSAKNPDGLVSGLRNALAGVSARKASGAAAATSNLEPVAGDNFAFVANYRTQKWDGDVQARLIDIVTGKIGDTAVWSAQTQLDAMVDATSDTRTIITFVNGAQKIFAPGNFTAAEKALWFNPNANPKLTQVAGWSTAQTLAATPDTLINYLRGHYGFEDRSVNALPLYRLREHVLGDVVNGKPVFVRKPPFNYSENAYTAFKTGLASRTGAVFVAANDGMLHAFNADTGKEMWAYVPSFVLPKLKLLADTDYANNHTFTVDGSPTVSDIWNGSAWRTILVAGLNAGGKGYYAIDVTNPGSPTVLWEFSHADMGYSFGNPIVAKLQDGTWNVAVSSGYNNTAGGGHLFVLNAWTGALKYTLNTGVGTSTDPSGLTKLSAWVDEGLEDNTMQRVYGGDLYGNLWRFDVNGVLPPTGRDAVLLASFVAGAYRQPITTKPELGLVQGKAMVYVGTGKYLGTPDLTDLGQQSLYAIRDDLTGTGIGLARSSSSCPLIKQTLVIINENLRTTSNTPVDLTASCGWFLDFNPGNQTPGERVNVDPKLQLGVLAVAANIPEKSVCNVGGSSFLYFFDYAKGTFVATAGSQVAGARVGNSLAVGLNTYRLPDDRVVTTVTTSDDQHPVFENPDNPNVGTMGKRVMWRELLN